MAMPMHIRQGSRLVNSRALLLSSREPPLVGLFQDSQLGAAQEAPLSLLGCGGLSDDCVVEAEYTIASTPRQE